MIAEVVRTVTEIQGILEETEGPTGEGRDRETETGIIEFVLLEVYE